MFKDLLPGPTIDYIWQTPQEAARPRHESAPERAKIIHALKGFEATSSVPYAASS
jgi:hypothetical protein